VERKHKTRGMGSANQREGEKGLAPAKRCISWGGGKEGPALHLTSEKDSRREEKKEKKKKKKKMEAEAMSSAKENKSNSPDVLGG